MAQLWLSRGAAVGHNCDFSKCSGRKSAKSECFGVHKSSYMKRNLRIKNVDKLMNEIGFCRFRIQLIIIFTD